MFHVTHTLRRVVLIMSALSAIIATITTTKGHNMTLEEYKALIEAQRKESLAQALALLTKEAK